MISQLFWKQVPILSIDVVFCMSEEFRCTRRGTELRTKQASYLLAITLGLLIDWLINQSINQYINGLINQSIDGSINRWIDLSINQSINEKIVIILVIIILIYRALFPWGYKVLLPIFIMLSGNHYSHFCFTKGLQLAKCMAYQNLLCNFSHNSSLVCFG